MPRSNTIARCVLVAGSLLAMLHADELSLTGGNARLSGTVRSLDSDGVLTLASELSAEPLRLKPGSVEKIVFSSPAAMAKPPAALVELANGDLLPATVESLTEDRLTVTSPAAGRLEIPRSAIRSLQLGVARRNQLYAGPRSLEEWTMSDDDAKNWNFDHQALIANGPATAAKNLELPTQFILRFTVRWQPKQHPNLQVFFADPLAAKGEPCDRYYLQYGSAGLEIKREAATGKRWSSIVQLNRNPSLYPDNQLKVELRVDRKSSRLQLLLNDEPEGQYVDPIPSVPTGGGITLVCNSQPGNPQEIRDIEVIQTDNGPSRHHAEERGDAKTDALISRDDNRWSGQLVEIRNRPDGRIFRFKSSFQEDVLEIPEGEVSTVFFAGSDAKTTATTKAKPFILRLRGDGALHVTSSVFTPDAVTAEHPLLGPLSLHRDGIAALEQAPADKPSAAPAP